MLRQIEEKYQEIERKRTEFLDKFSEKDEDGKAIIENGTYKINEEGKELFDKEYHPILEESFELTLVGNQRSVLKTILSDMKIALTKTDGEIYDDILTYLEKK